MPPNEPCPHCGEIVLDWHNEWYVPAQRKAIYQGQAAMGCPHCRGAVLWISSRDLTVPLATSEVEVCWRSPFIAAQWVPVRESACVDLAGYIANHPAGQRYGGYWQPDQVRQADLQVNNP
jgi:hypothetical protein